MRPSNIIFFGYGYTAKYIAAELDKNKFNIITSNRDGLNNLKFYYPEHIPEINWNNITHIISSIPPINGVDPVISSFKNEILNASNLRYIGYLSSTAVYGDHQGKIVNEQSPLLASANSTGYTRKNIEQLWQEIAVKNSNINLNIFRLSGIYGPFRSILDNLNNKEYILSKPDHFFSRIHVEDIAKIITQAISYNLPNQIFNLADDLASTPEDPYLFAYKLLNLPSPPLRHYSQLELSSMMKDFLNNNKIIDNSKIKNILNLNLKYPSYKQGLSTIFEQNQYVFK